MLDQRLLTFIGSLTDFGQRPRATKKLAEALGAEDLILFTQDPSLHILLPAPGFPQTLPEGKKWAAFLKKCSEERQASLDLISPYSKALVPVLGVHATDGSVLALLGGQPKLDLVININILVPLLAAALLNERVTQAAKGQIEIESNSAEKSRALVATLYDTRKELEAALREIRNSHELYRTTLHSIGDAVIAVDRFSNVTYLNPVAEHLTGWKLAEAVSRPLDQVFKILHEQTRRPVANPVDRVLQDGVTMSLATPKSLIWKDGQHEFIIEDSAAPILSDDNKVIGAVLVFRDTTEKHKADKIHHELLRELERSKAEAEAQRSRLYQSFMQAPVGIAMLTGPDHRFEMVNPTYLSLLFGGSRDVIGKPLRQAVPESIEQGFLAILDNVYKSGVAFIGKEHPIDLVQVDASLKRFYLNFVYQPLFNSAGKIDGIIAVIVDVTEQVQARKTVEENSTLLNAISEASSDFIFAKNQAGQLIFANPAISKTLGKSKSEILGHTDIDFLGEEIGTPIMENDRRIMKSGEAEFVEEVIFVDGLAKNYVTNKIPYRGSDGLVAGLLGISRDMTDLRHAQQELSAIVTRLEHERELRDRFISTLTHDLRSPMTAAKMTAQLIARKTDKNENVHKQATKIVSNIDRADHMIQNLLDSNRLQAGEKLTLTMSESSLKDIITEVLSDLKIIYGDRFQFLPPDQDIKSYCNSDSLKRVIENLAINAVKYGAADQPVKVELSKKDDQAFISVHNSGNPIAAEDQLKIFSPFNRSRAAQMGGQKGWGLGLTVVKGMIESHGGTVRLESSEQNGTSFIVNLPIDSRPSGAS